MGRVIKESERRGSVTVVSKEVREAAAQLAAAQAAVNRLSEVARKRVVELSLRVAERIVGEVVTLEPARLERIYASALAALGPIADQGELWVHPLDREASAVDEWAKRAGLAVRSDEAVGQGGVRVRCGGAELDASLPALIERVRDALNGAGHPEEVP